MHKTMALECSKGGVLNTFYCVVSMSHLCNDLLTSTSWHWIFVFWSFYIA